MDDKSIIFEGYLQKESIYLNVFRKKWIVLKNDRQMYSYKNENIYDINPTEIIDLKLCKNVKVLNGNKFALIFDKNKQTILVADSQMTMNQWIKYIKTIINDKNNCYVNIADFFFLFICNNPYGLS